MPRLVPVGIDLGTTYSAVAVLRPTGRPEILPNKEGEDITPSVVLFQSMGDHDEPLVGTMAKHAASSAPDDVAQFVKRNMGNPAWQFDSSSGIAYGAEEVSALILRRLKEDAELALGHEVLDAVITVPAYFDDARRRATIDAGRIAGLNVLRILNEPTAAALAFGLDTMSEGAVLVYDLGGGTFDVTLMVIGPGGTFDVLATDGDRNLGGFDFDNRLMQYVAGAVLEQGGPDLLEDEYETAALREKCEIAKRSLTTVAATMVHVGTRGRSFRIKIDRALFDELTADLVRRTQDLAESVLDDADYSWDRVDHVVLVGGSTRMPVIREMVERLAGRPVDRSVNPDEAVALGAAIQAAMESVEAAPQEMSIYGGVTPTISDVTSQSLGAISRDREGRDVNHIIIHRNSKIPAKFGEQFYTIVEQQDSVRIEVTQGDDTDPQFVTVVGEKVLDLPRYPKGAPIEIIYAYDIDQTIFVEVIDTTAGRSLGTFEVDRTANLDEAEVDEARARVARMTIL